MIQSCSKIYLTVTRTHTQGGCDLLLIFRFLSIPFITQLDKSLLCVRPWNRVPNCVVITTRLDHLKLKYIWWYEGGARPEVRSGWPKWSHSRFSIFEIAISLPLSLALRQALISNVTKAFNPVQLPLEEQRWGWGWEFVIVMMDQEEPLVVSHLICCLLLKNDWLRTRLQLDNCG